MGVNPGSATGGFGEVSLALTVQECFFVFNDVGGMPPVDEPGLRQMDRLATETDSATDHRVNHPSGVLFASSMHEFTPDPNNANR